MGLTALLGLPLTLGLTRVRPLGVRAGDQTALSVVVAISAFVVAVWSTTGAVAWLRCRGRGSEGGNRRLDAVGQPVADDGAGACDWALEGRDIDAQVTAQTALRASESRYRLLAENASDVVCSLSVDRDITWVSPSVTSVLGYAVEDLLGRPAACIVHPQDMPIVDEFLALQVRGRSHAVRVRLRSKAAAPIWCRVSARRVLDRDAAFAGLVMAVRDVSGEVAAQEALQHEMAFDALTGLPRKEFALQRIRALMEDHVDGARWLLCIGVNGMTQINQAYTYTAGDAVLKTVAQRLVGTVGARDGIARIAGDEFVVLTSDVMSADGAVREAERILSAVRGRLVVGDTELHVSASIGIAMAQSGDAEELLRDATAAMRQAAQKGPDRWEFLDGNVGARTRDALHIQNELRAALLDGRIEAWYMPVVEVPDRQVVGYEVLTRWRREDGAVWGPDRFLGIAERSGLIGELDRTVFSQTLAAAQRAPAGIGFSYNVSAVSLGSEAFPGWVTAELAASGVDPRRLTFEITETSLFEVTGRILATMQALAALGIDWWVDDFGTGFSSISHLRDLPIAGLKLDKSFTAGIATDDGRAQHLAGGLLGLARGLRLTAVAEGVETAEQESVLIRQGWPLAQGWLYGRPAPHHW